IEYITIFAFNNNFQSDQNIAELIQLYNDSCDDYLNLINYAKTVEYIDDEVIEQINNELLSISDNLILLNYKKKISESLEQMNLLALTENGKHWRQYMKNDLTINEDSSFLFVSSFKEGILADALFYATYYTNRINDSFN
ncbi:hypothetical protein, partial [Treponema sp. R6D11]